MKTQSCNIGQAGSFFNQLMSNNSSVPVVGQGATEMLYTDRRCYEVVEVSEDGKTARLQYLDAKWDSTQPGGQGHQNWILEPTNQFVTVTWKHGAWRTIGKEITFTKEFRAECESKGIPYIGQWLRQNNPELADQIWGTEGRPFPQNVVEGYTYERKVYNKIRILFGSKDYYYDWSF